MPEEKGEEKKEGKKILTKREGQSSDENLLISPPYTPDLHITLPGLFFAGVCYVGIYNDIIP